MVYFKSKNDSRWTGPATVIGQGGQFVLVRNQSNFIRVHPTRLQFIQNGINEETDDKDIPVVVIEVDHERDSQETDEDNIPAVISEVGHERDTQEQVSEIIKDKEDEVIPAVSHENGLQEQNPDEVEDTEDKVTPLVIPRNEVDIKVESDKMQLNHLNQIVTDVYEKSTDFRRYSPTCVKLAIIIGLILIACSGWRLRRIDIKSECLQSDQINRHIVDKSPKESKTKTPWLLKKTVYGLKKLRGIVKVLTCGAPKTKLK